MRIKNNVNIHKNTAIAEYPIKRRKPKGFELFNCFTESVYFDKDFDTFSCLEVILPITSLSLFRSPTISFP